MNHRRKAWAATLLALGAAGVWIPRLANAIDTTEPPARPDVAADGSELRGEYTSTLEDPLQEHVEAAPDEERTATASAEALLGGEKASHLAAASALVGAAVRGMSLGENRLERSLRAIEDALPVVASVELDPIAPAWSKAPESSARLDPWPGSMPAAGVTTPSPAAKAGDAKSAQKQTASGAEPQPESKP